MTVRRLITGGSGMRAGFPRTTLTSMDDILIEGLVPGETLIWNGSFWENAAPASGGDSSMTFFVYDVAGSIATYLKLGTTPSDTIGSAITATITPGTSPVLLNKWVTPELNKTALEGGVWSFLLYGGVNIATDDTLFRIKVSTIATAGGSETMLFTVDSETIESSPTHPINITTVQPSFAGLLATDKLKLEIYAVTTHTPSVSVTLFYGALDAQTRFDSPFIINHDDLPGIDIAGSVKLHLPTLTAQGDLSGTYPDPLIKASLKDGDPAIPCLRSLGTLSNQACAGDDPRLIEDHLVLASATDTTPGVLEDKIAVDPEWSGLTLSVQDPSGNAKLKAKINDSYNIIVSGDENAVIVKAGSLTPNEVDVLYKNGEPSTYSMRSLGTQSNQACAGDDPRLIEDYKFKVLSTDTAQGFLEDKLIPYDSLSGLYLTTQDPTGNAKRVIGIRESNHIYIEGEQDAPAIRNDCITPTQVFSAYKDGNPSDPCMRTLGVLSNQACAGDDVRLTEDHKVSSCLTDQTPGFLVDKLEAGMAIALSLLESSPTDTRLKIDVVLGTQSDQACAGNDPRLTEAHLVLASSTDTTPGVLEDKIAVDPVWSGLTLSVQDPSGDAKLKVKINDSYNIIVSGDENAVIVKAGSLTPNEVNVLYKNGEPSTYSMRTLGTQSNQACAGDDPRLTDDYKFKVLSTDTSQGYLEDKLIPYDALSGLYLTTQDPTGDAKRVIGIRESNHIYIEGEQDAPAIRNNCITPAQVNSDYKDGLPSDYCMRTLGTLSNQACAGNDARLIESDKVKVTISDLSGGYLNDKLSGGTAIQLTTIAPGGTETLDVSVIFGTLSNQACAGNDARLSDSRTPTSHAFAGALHSADTLANLNSKISDADVLSTAAGELAALTNKSIPVEADYLLIEDSAATNAKKNILIGDLPKYTSINGVHFYLESAASAVEATYYQLSRNAANPGSDLSGTVNTSEGDKLIKSYMFDNVLGRTTMGAGYWQFNFYTKVSSASDVTRLLVKVYTRTAAGVETLRFTTGYSGEINNTDIAKKIIDYAAAGQSGFAAADYIVVKVYATTTSVADVTVTIGSSHAGWSFFICTLYSISQLGGEVNILASKGSPVAADILLAEDSEASFTKKKITIANLATTASFDHAFGGAKHTADTLANLNGKISDADVISTAAGEINALTVKAAPTTSDMLMIEDAADTNKKKKITIATLPTAAAFPEFQFFADQLKAPWESTYPVHGNDMASAAVDSANNSITNRQFDDATAEGVAFDVFIPAGVTNVIFDIYARAQAATGSVQGVIPGIYTRQIADNAAAAAWSARTQMTTISIPATNAYYQYDTQTIALASFATVLVAGRLTQFEFVRTPGVAGDDLIGDWNLFLLRVRFS